MGESGSYLIGAPLNGPIQSVLDRFEAMVALHADSIALVAVQQPSDLYGMKSQPLEAREYAERPYLRWTYRELRAAIDLLVRALSARGVKRGSQIFTFLQNGAEFSMIFLASDILGCTLVPINIRNLANSEEVDHMIRTARKADFSSSKPVVFADGVDTASKLNQFDALSEATKLLTGDSAWEQWNALGSLLIENPSDQTFVQQPAELPWVDQSGLILFTSGTTSLPKGVKWHHPDLACFLRGKELLGEAWHVGHGDVVASLAPNNHAMGCIVSMMALSLGATILYPAPFFEPSSFLAAARAERCTLAVAVPTMVYALLLAKSDQGIRLEHLRSVLLGGAAVTPEVVKICITELGAKGVENGYGMTERLWCMSGSQQPEVLFKDSDVTVGTAWPGTRWKVCAPNSRSPLPRCQIGELHGSMPFARSPYIGRTADEYYEDNGVPWMITGDSAYIDEQGRMFICGRYKEMIIRGGENISPAAMEACITTELPQFRSLQIQIIGARDQIAGEVPIAITLKAVDAEAAKRIQDVVISKMGKIYSIDEFICIEELGSKDYPRTMAGKVQKNRLTHTANQYVQKRDAVKVANGALDSVDGSLTKQIMQIWSRFTGVDAVDLTLTTSLEELGDSITLMRVKDRVCKQTGVNLTVKDMMEAHTVGNMIKMVAAQVPQYKASDDRQFKTPDRPPVMEDMIYAVDDDDMYEVTKKVVTEAIKGQGLTWEDVRDVMPAYDFTDVAAKNGTLDQWSFKISLLFQNVDVKTARAALAKAMANNPMQTSFLIWDEELLGDDLTIQFTVDQKDSFLNNLIEDCGTLATVDDLKKKAADMVMFQGAQYPGPLFRAYVFFVEETKCAGIIWNMHHAITDASFAQLFLEDVDQALAGTPLKPHVPYKLYCDNFYSLRTSPPARAATRYHVRKLKDLAKHIPNYFPPRDRSILQIESPKPDGYIHMIPADDLHKLCAKHSNIAPSVVVKAAYALFLLDTTKHTHAMFSQVEGARDKFPFLSSAVAAAAKLEACDVGGQLYQSVFNLTFILPNETTAQFLSRLQEEQLLQTKYASAPWKEIMRGLDPEVAGLFPKLATDCIFNWLGSNAEQAQGYSRLEILESQLRRDVAKFVINASMLRGKTGDKVVFHARGSVWSVDELRGFAQRVGAAALWLSDPQNWDRPVAEFMKWANGL